MSWAIKVGIDSGKRKLSLLQQEVQEGDTSDMKS